MSRDTYGSELIKFSEGGGGSSSHGLIDLHGIGDVLDERGMVEAGRWIEELDREGILLDEWIEFDDLRGTKVRRGVNEEGDGIDDFMEPIVIDR